MPEPITSILIRLSGNDFVLKCGKHVLGRATDCAVSFDDPLASRHHAEIEVTHEHVVIRDLGSRNGVLLNGDEIGSFKQLVVGDLITLGSQAITLVEIRGRESEISTRTSRSGSGAQPIAKIAVAQRAVTQEEAVKEATNQVTTMSHSMSPLNRPLPAFKLIAEAATRAIAEGSVKRAERILDGPLVEVLSTLRAGMEVEEALVTLAAEQAIALARATRKRVWLDYIDDLYGKCGRPLPPPLADEVASVARLVR